MEKTDLFPRIFLVIRILLVVAIAYGLFRLIIFATPLLYPFLIGSIIAYIINTPVDLLQHRAKWSRWLAVITVLSVVLLVFFGFITFLVTQLIVETGNLMDMLPFYINSLTIYIRDFLARGVIAGFYDSLMNFYTSLDANYKSQIQANVNDVMSKLAETGTVFTKSILMGIRNFLSSIPNAATVMVISILSAFFISKDYYKIKNGIKSLIPDVYANKVSNVTLDLQKALFGFIKAQLTLISITAVIVIIGLLFMGVPYAVSIGLLIGIVDLMPYLGTGAVFVPWILYSLFTSNYGMVIGLSILYAIVIVQRQIMEPKIVAANVGLDPLMTLIALFAGLQLFGFTGLILGPVILVVLNALWRARIIHDLWNYILHGTHPIK